MDSSIRISTLSAPMPGTKWDWFSDRLGLVSIEWSLEVQESERQDLRDGKPAKCSQGQGFWDSMRNGAD